MALVFFVEINLQINFGVVLDFEPPVIFVVLLLFLIYEFGNDSIFFHVAIDVKHKFIALFIRCIRDRFP